MYLQIKKGEGYIKKLKKVKDLNGGLSIVGCVSNMTNYFVLSNDFTECCQKSYMEMVDNQPLNLICDTTILIML